MSEAADVLAEVPLFALLDESQRSLLFKNVETVRFGQGTVLFQANDPGDRLYVVLSGEVEIYFISTLGDRVVLEVAGPGHFFGEVSLLDGGPRTASAKATTDAELLVVDRADLEELFRRSPASALALLAAAGRRLRETTRLLRHSASRNVNQEAEDTRTWVMKSADWISAFSGSLTFLGLHVVAFTVWIGLNVTPFNALPIGGFDPFPFGLLTMSVSLEAIILSVFVLLSQNRQAERDRVRNDVEYEVNLKAELEVSQLHVKVDDLRAEVLGRLAALERRPPG